MSHTMKNWNDALLQVLVETQQLKEVKDVVLCKLNWKEMPVNYNHVVEMNGSH